MEYIIIPDTAIIAVNRGKHHHLLSGSKIFRYLALWNLINKTKYTTYDLS